MEILTWQYETISLLKGNAFTGIGSAERDDCFNIKHIKRLIPAIDHADL